MIWDHFRLQITKYPTLSSLAFGIFRTQFLINKEDIKKDSRGNLVSCATTRSKIHMLSGKIAEDIRSSYTGGAVDMYIPHPPSKVKIFAYDVNSFASLPLCYG